MILPKVSKKSFRTVFITLVSIYGIFVIFTAPFVIGILQVQEEYIAPVLKTVPDLTIYPANGSDVINAVQVDNELKKISGIDLVSHIVISTGEIQFQNRSTRGLLEGIMPSKFNAVTPSIRILSGHFLEDGDTNETVLSDTIAGLTENIEGLGTKVGDRVRIIFDANTSRDYNVKGIARSTVVTRLDTTALLPISEMESVFPDLRGMATEIQLKLISPSKADEVKSQIQRVLAQKGIRAEIRTKAEELGSFGAPTPYTQAAESLKNLLFGVGLSVAGILIALHRLSRKT